MARNNWFILFGLIAALAFGGCEKTVKQENGFLIGTVTVDGVAVSGVTISVYSYSTSSGNPKISSELISTETAAGGGYRIELLSGEYRIDFDLMLDGEQLHTARYPVKISTGVETIIDVELKDPVPRNLIGKDDDVSVMLTWEHAYHATGYNIYRALASDDIYNLIAHADSAFGTVTYIDTPPEIDIYLYKITATTQQGESEPSAIVVVNFTASISPPSNFTAIDNITHVSLDWTSKTNASLYKIFRAVNSSPDSWALVDSTAQSFYEDSPAAYDIYRYYVTAVSFLGTESTPSQVRTVNYDGRFDPPSGVTLVDRGSNLYLTWLPEDNVGYYNIYRTQNPDDGFTRIDSTMVPHYEDVPTLFGYYYYVVSIVGPNNMESEMSDVVSSYYDGRLEPPDQVYATDLGLSVEVSWSQVLWAAAYIVYRSDDGGVTYNQISRVSGENLSKIDNPPEAGDYYYKVSTETFDGVIGSLSGAANVYFTDNLPRPVNLTAENFGTFVQLSWDEVSSATGYTIHRSNSPTGAYAQIGSSPDPEYTDIPQTAGAYYYKVRAVDTLGHESPFSFYAYAYYSDQPQAPFNVSAVDLSYRVSISWESIDSSFIFIIYRSTSSAGDYTAIDTVDSELQIYDWPSSSGHYYYKVRAEHPSHGSSDLSQYGHVYFSGILETPDNLDVTDHGQFISLSWSSVEGAAEYSIFRGTDINELVLNQTVYVPDTTATDQPDSAGTYYYAVLAKTQGGLESPRSAPVGVVFNP